MKTILTITSTILLSLGFLVFNKLDKKNEYVASAFVEETNIQYVEFATNDMVNLLGADGELITSISRAPETRGSSTCVEGIAITLQNGLDCPNDIDGVLAATITRSPDCFGTVLYRFRWEKDGIQVREFFANQNNLADVLNPAGSTTGEVPAGEYEVFALDLGDDSSGITVTDTFTLAGQDNTDPQITCPANITTTTDAGVCTANVTFSNATATDNCDGTLTPSQTGGLSSGSDFPIGVSTIEYTATDASGNTEVCSFTITVEDQEPPVLSCPADVTVEIVLPTLFTVPDYFNLGDVTASDNCTDPVTILSQTPAPGTMLGEGDFTVNFTAEDASGNVGSCSFLLTVDDILSVEDVGLSESITIYNPIQNTMIITNENRVPLTNAQLFDISGKLLMELDLSTMDREHTTNVSGLSSGIFLLKINNETGSVVKKLVKQ